MSYIFFILKKIMRFFPPKVHIQLLYFKCFKKFVNFRHPKTFNEKLQWLKMYNKDPLYTRLVDKVAVKDYVASIIGEKFVIPTYNTWAHAKDVDFSSLPNKFVIKWNHDSRSVIICKNKNLLDEDKILKQLDKYEKHNAYWYGREWPYKNVKPLILAEQLLEDGSGESIRDYKFFCFSGNPKAVQVDFGRFETHKRNFYSVTWEKMPIILSHENENGAVPKPINFDLMVDIAKKLSKPFPFVRVDLYNINGKIYFGEMTFFPGSGVEKFTPSSWDDVFGSWLSIPE